MAGCISHHRYVSNGGDSMRAPLNADNLEFAVSPEGIILDLTVLQYLREAGYNVEKVHSLHTVKRANSDTGHVVVEADVTTLPTDHPEFDAVEDVTTMFVCDCWDYLSNRWPDLREVSMHPQDAGSCVHIRTVSREEKARNDENQTELDP